MIDFTQESKDVAQLHSKLELLEQTKRREEQESTKAALRLRHCQDAQEIIQHLAQAVQQQAHDRIASVVSSCLSAVFDDPYMFRIVFERKRGRTEATLRFTRRGLEVDPLTASGGGMVDVAAFALRAACLVLHQPKLSRVLVLDEPLKFVSREFRPGVKQMLERLSEDLGVQIVMVTHAEDLVAGKVIQL